MLLTLLLVPVAYTLRLMRSRHLNGLYNCILLATRACLLTVFLAGDIVVFYVAFESCLIPLAILIGLYRSGAARLRAATLFFLYTLGGSLAILVAIVLAFLVSGSVGLTDSSLHVQIVGRHGL